MFGRSFISPIYSYDMSDEEFEFDDDELEGEAVDPLVGALNDDDDSDGDDE